MTSRWRRCWRGGAASKVLGLVGGLPHLAVREEDAVKANSFVKFLFFDNGHHSQPELLQLLASNILRFYEDLLCETMLSPYGSQNAMVERIKYAAIQAGLAEEQLVTTEVVISCH